MKHFERRQEYSFGDQRLATVKHAGGFFEPALRRAAMGHGYSVERRWEGTFIIDTEGNTCYEVIVEDGPGAGAAPLQKETQRQIKSYELRCGSRVMVRARETFEYDRFFPGSESWLESVKLSGEVLGNDPLCQALYELLK